LIYNPFMPAAEIITIGTELLLGETIDTNTRYLARQLRSLGIDLFRTQMIGDNVGRIVETVQQALQRADIIITTGGLGPTVDDPTRQAIANCIGVQLEFHPELWEQISTRIAGYGRTPTGNQKRQAYIPKGAMVIENPVGTAPAFIVEISPNSSASEVSSGRGKVIISLPGVPSEMETLLSDAIIPFLKNHFALHAVMKIRTLHTSGLGEGMIDDQISDLELLANPTVGLTAHSGIVDVRIVSKAETEAEADRMVAIVENDLRSRLGNNLFGIDECTLEGVTLDAVAKRGWTFSCLEVNLEQALLARFEKISHPAYQGGHYLQFLPESLATEVEAIIKKFDTSTALGVAYSQEGKKQDVHIFLVSPLGRSERHLTYGGHPSTARRWAANMAMDWLRRSAQASG
jgi:nicotinamide-nucleotide amidase